MKFHMMLVAVALIAIGCGKKNDTTPSNDSTAAGGGMKMGGDTAQKSGMHGDSSGMAGGMMMSGDMEKDMAMMDDMMLAHLGAKDSLYDQRFIDMMIMHHECAVMMAKDAPAHANKAELKTLAQSIITSQQKEIDMMKQWRAKWYGGKASNGMAGADSMKGDMKMMGDMKSMNDMMIKKLGQKDADYEDRFIDMMIPHHEGGVRMANDALAKASHPELKKLAQDIITAQQKEIAQMEGWRKEWYGH
jgi:uncharacterized protein (DUF305 family)